MRKAQFALRPAPQDDIMRAFVWLGSVCAMKNEAKAGSQQEQDQLNKQRNLRYASMIDALMEYPGDLVLDALKRWPTANTWFPEASQIMQMVDKETQARKSLLAAIERAPEAKPKEQQKKWDDLTDEEKAAHEKRSEQIKNNFTGLKKLKVDNPGHCS